MLSKPKERQFTCSSFKENRTLYLSVSVSALGFDFTAQSAVPYLLPRDVCRKPRRSNIKVILIRHCKVKYDWRSFYSSAEFDRACRDYDRAPIEAAEPSVIQEAVGAVYISRLERSKSTALCFFDKAKLKQTELLDEVPLKSAFDTELRLPLWFWNLDKAKLKQTELLDEVPLKSAFDTELRLPLWFWNLTGRIQWFLNHPRQVETRRLTERRAKKLVRKVCAAGEDCILVTHGFYMHTMIKEFQKSGFQTKQQRVHYQNGQGITLWLPTPREGQA